LALCIVIATKSSGTILNTQSVARRAEGKDARSNGSAALIFPGEKLNALFATRRVNYKDVIHNLLTSSLLPEIINHIHVIYLLGRFANAQFCSRQN